MAGVRILDTLKANRYIDALKVPRFVKAVLRCLVSKVDARTSASHPRFPIVQAAIARAIDYSIAHLCRALNALERLGLVIRRQSRHQRRADGTWRQDPTDYQLTLPDECYRLVQRAETTVATREVATYAPRIDDAPTFDDEFDGELTDDDRVELCVRGTVKPPRDGSSWDVNGFDDSTIPGDEVPANVVAQQIVDAGSLALDRVPDSRKFIATNAIHELKQRAHEVALTICQQGLTAARGCGVVRQWVEKTLGNVDQVVHSAAHALNILRKFIVGAAHETRRAFEAGRARGLERHRAGLAPLEVVSGIVINRVVGASSNSTRHDSDDDDEIPFHGDYPW
jgi:hypothetical protein